MKLCLHCNQYFDEPVEKCPSDGAILENVGKDPLIGALINNRYLVDSVVGKGSSGIVYKARRLGRGEVVVAIKVLHSYIGAAGSSLDRFLREAQAASRLRNPHIITIWESGVTEDGQPYFVMDYLEGTTLGHLIKDKGNLDPVRVLSLLRQICEALSEAHRQGIVHRDLKPENVVLQESDHGHDYIKLLDFGIADSPQHAQSSFKLEKPKTVSGSPAYMSPEQCQGLELDGRSDIYSLAIVVFEMLTGQRPFPQKENVNVMVLHVNEPPMTLADVRADLAFPQAVEGVIARALSKRPNDRQATVQEFLSEFEQAWKESVHQASISIKASEQLAPSQPTPNQSLTSQPNYFSQIKEIRQESEITSDDLGLQDGTGSSAAWGNVSIQSSGKAALAAERRSIFDAAETSSNNSDISNRDSYLVNIWNAKPEAAKIASPLNTAPSAVTFSHQTHMGSVDSNAQFVPAAQMAIGIGAEQKGEHSFAAESKEFPDAIKAKASSGNTIQAINQSVPLVKFPQELDMAPTSTNEQSVSSARMPSIATVEEKIESSFIEQNFGADSNKPLDIKDLDASDVQLAPANVSVPINQSAPSATLSQQADMADTSSYAPGKPAMQTPAISTAQDKNETNFTNANSVSGAPITDKSASPLNTRIDPSATGKMKTIERLMQAAKRGQTGARSTVSNKVKIPIEPANQPTQPIQTSQYVPNKAELMQSAQALQSAQPTQPITPIKAPIHSLSQVQLNEPPEPDEMLARLLEKSQSIQALPVTPSGWHAVCEERPLLFKTASDLSSEPTSEFNHPVSRQANPPQVSLSAPSLHSEPLFPQYTPSSAVSEVEIPSLTTSENARSESYSLKAESEAAHSLADEKIKEAQIFIKQKYRGTLSRVQALHKANRTDNSLIAAKVRTATLNADFAKPPKNLWHVAISIVVAACLLACAYVVYSKLTTPIPPVTSIDTLMATGNYEQVMDILEGKSLSMPLSNEEREQLNYTYLAMAKSDIENKKPDQALDLLAKIAPSSPSAIEANQLKTELKNISSSPATSEATQNEAKPKKPAPQK